jgi:hypothetical protein
MDGDAMLLQNYLARITSDYDKAKSNIKVALQYMDDASFALHEIKLENEDDQELTKAIKGCELKFKEMLDCMYSMKKEEEACLALKAEIPQYLESLKKGEYSLADDFVSKSQPAVDSFMAKGDQKYNEFVEYRDHMTKLGELMGQPTEETNDDLMITNERENLVCPLSQLLMDTVYTSRKCKHSFSSVIVQAIRDSRIGRIECPVVGCVQYVTLGDLKKNLVLQRKVDAERRATQLSQAQEEYDDVSE